MSDIEEDIRSLSDDLVADAQRLASIEEQKSRLDANDPRMDELAQESERLARGMVPKTVAERRLTEEVADSA